MRERAVTLGEELSTFLTSPQPVGGVGMAQDTCRAGWVPFDASDSGISKAACLVLPA